MRRLTSGAHPRSRGENAMSAYTPGYRRGSSPLTRGKRTGVRSSGFISGLIPAHAGKTRRPVPHLSARGAHPRSRGENLVAYLSLYVGWGSSPLTRGKLRHELVQEPDDRLIPAHAGKTQKRYPVESNLRAHPRSRGENNRLPVYVWRSRGSSPLTRGKQSIDPKCVFGHGLIPAHAGKTLPQVLSQVGVGAHPRSRGENR